MKDRKKLNHKELFALMSFLKDGDMREYNVEEVIEAMKEAVPHLNSGHVTRTASSLGIKLKRRAHARVSKNQETDRLLARAILSIQEDLGTSMHPLLQEAILRIAGKVA